VRADDIIWGNGDAAVLDVTAKVKQDLEAQAGHAQLRIILRHGATDAELATLVARLPWVEYLVLDEPTKVTSLAPVAKLTKLRALHLNTNAVKTIAPLAKHATLDSLVLTCSKDFTDKDLRGLDGITTLQRLDLRACTSITDLHGLEKAANLQAVSTFGTPLANIDALAGHAQMRILHLYDTRVANLAPLAGMPELGILNLSRSPASSFDALRGLTKLRTVDLSQTNIKSLDVLAASTSLTWLMVMDAKSLSFAKVPAWTKMTRLHVDGTNLADLTPLTGLTSLEYLSFDRTAVTSIAPVFLMPNVKSVTVPGAISDADVLALEKARPGIDVVRYGRPLPGRAPMKPIP
jgi:internalin A